MAEKRDYSRQRLGRRRMLGGAALSGVGLIAAAVISCKETTPVADSVASGLPKRGGALNHKDSFESRGQQLDPHTQPLAVANGYRLFYQGLLGPNPRTYEPEPELAQKWEQASATEIVFTLQQGVKWHNKPPANGRDMTIQDVLFSLERVRSRDPQFINRTILDTVDKIEAVDRTTLRVTLNGPDASIVNKFAADSIMVLAPEVVEKAGRFATADEVVGTGAFILRSVEQGIGAEYVRNPDYWKAGLPYLDGFRTRFFEDDQTAYAAFLAGRMDITPMPGPEVKRYIARQGPNFTPDWFKDITLTTIAYPNTRRKPFDDRRVTRALRLLVDHEEFIRLLEETSGGGRNGQLFPPALDAWDLTHEEYSTYLEWKQPKDEAAREALTLLRAAGFTRENPLKFDLGGYSTAGLQPRVELLQANWRRLGQGVVETELKLIDFAQALPVLARGQFDYWTSGHGANAIDPDVFLTQLYHSNGSRNYMKFSDPKLDEMIDKQRGLFNLAERKALVRQIHIYYIDHGVSTYTAGSLRLWATNPKVRGYAPEFQLNGRQYEQVWLDS